LYSAIEPGTPQDLAFRITYERYGYYHEGYCNLKWPKEDNDECIEGT